MFQNLLEIYKLLCNENKCIYNDYKIACENCKNLKNEIKKQNKCICRYKKQKKILTQQLKELDTEFNNMLNKYNNMKMSANKNEEFELV